MATTLRSSLRLPAAGAVSSSRPTWRHANAGALLRLLKRTQGTRLRVFCSSPRSDPETKWWMAPLRPEDLVEPTGQGKEEVEAIWNALVEEPLRPVLLALQEIAATGGNIFRCRCFHAGLVSGPLLRAGFCQVYGVAPNLCLDILLGYTCYKLSVLAAQLKRDGRANNICARIQFVLLVVLLCKSNNSNKGSYYYVTQLIWLVNDLATCYALSIFSVFLFAKI